MARNAAGSRDGNAHRQGALIVGASSGIGAALARVLAQRGYTLALVARREDALSGLASSLDETYGGGATIARYYAHDVLDFAGAPDVYEHILNDFTAADVALDLVVYSAGIMPHGHTGPWTFEEEHDIVETNVTGAMRWLSLGAQTLTTQGYGALVAISSVAGDRGRRGNSAYMASKAALSTYLESLRYRLATTGVRVLTIKPGLVATPMTTAGDKKPGLLTARVERVASSIADACARGNGVLYVPVYWGAIMRVIRMMPSAMLSRLNI